ncbi:DUF559 domain-containing protein [Lysinibacillus sp. FSL P4-0201]|uniref:endonuclease domain-containing protein n=1 Tax=Lysinibacillus sp. FSL P4-0201 TaxID=2921721 RepID=UPI00315B2A41
MKSTELEIIMRYVLLELGYVFDEQVYKKINNKQVIYDFVVYSEYAQIIIECDGFYHYFIEDIQKDYERDKYSINYGYDEILRFTSRQLRNDLEHVKNTIVKTIKQLDEKFLNNNERKQLNDRYKQIIKSNKASAMNYYGQINTTVKITKVESSPYFRPNVRITNNYTYNHSPKIFEKETFHIPANNENIYEYIDRVGGSKEIEGIRIIKSLENVDKKVLWDLIKNGTKDQSSIYKNNINDLAQLLSTKLIEINPFYKDTSNSKGVFILREFGNLYKLIKRKQIDK